MPYKWNSCSALHCFEWASLEECNYQTTGLNRNAMPPDQVVTKRSRFVCFQNCTSQCKVFPLCKSLCPPQARGHKLFPAQQALVCCKAPRATAPTQTTRKRTEHALTWMKMKYFNLVVPCEPEQHKVETLQKLNM